MRTVYLSEEERAPLERMVKVDAKPYRRERAAAILQVAAGTTAATVARRGLLRRREAETVCRWLDRFEEDGGAGWTLRAGRGRQPAFSPPALPDAGVGGDGAAASGPPPPRRVRAVAAPPAAPLDPGHGAGGAAAAGPPQPVRGLAAAGWPGATLEAWAWPLHRPDPHDRAKLGYRAARQEQVARASGRQVLLDQGESTYSRQPTLGFG